jgi:hypothetical protein
MLLIHAAQALSRLMSGPVKVTQSTFTNFANDKLVPKRLCQFARLAHGTIVEPAPWPRFGSVHGRGQAEAIDRESWRCASITRCAFAWRCSKNLRPKSVQKVEVAEMPCSSNPPKNFVLPRGSREKSGSTGHFHRSGLRRRHLLWPRLISTLRSSRRAAASVSLPRRGADLPR